MSLLLDDISFKELIDLAVQLDNRLREKRRERSSRRSPCLPQFFASLLTISSIYGFFAIQWFPPCISSFVLSGGAYAGRSDEAHSCRTTALSSGRLCIYCGQACYFLMNCPSLPKEQAHQALGGADEPCSILFLYLQVRWNGQITLCRFRFWLTVVLMIV